MKKLMLTGIILGFLGTNIFAQSKSISNSKNITKLNETSIIVYDEAVVPKNQIFYIHNSDGKLITTYYPGQVVVYGSFKELVDRLKNMTLGKKDKQNCFKVACPSGAPSDAVCWDCKPQ
jgi:hypothetical protein